VEAQEEVFKIMQGDSFIRFLKSFCQGLTYASSLNDLQVTLPDSLFDEFLAEIEESNGWKFVEINKGVKIWKKSYKGTSFKASRGFIVIDVPPTEVIALLNDIQMNKKLDPQLEKISLVQDLGGGISIIHMLYSFGALLIKKRDAVCMMMKRHHPKKGDTFIWRSVSRNDLPPDKDIIRMEIESSGFSVQSEGNLPNKTKVTYCLQIDPKGNIPETFLKKNRNSKPLILHRMKKYLERGQPEKSKIAQLFRSSKQED